MKTIKLLFCASIFLSVLPSCRDEEAEKEAARKAAWEAEKARGNKTVEETPGQSYAN